MDFTLTEIERELLDLGRTYAEREIAAVAPTAWHEERCPTEVLRGLAGALHDRQPPAAALRLGRTARALAAPACRGHRARRVRADGTRGWLGCALSQDAGQAGVRRLDAERAEGLHLERRHRHELRGDGSRQNRGRRWRQAKLRQLHRRARGAGVHLRAETARDRVEGPGYPGSVLRQCLGPRQPGRGGARRWPWAVPRRARGGPDLGRRAFRWHRAGGAAAGYRLRAAARAVRGEDLQLPGDPVQARGHGDGDRGRVVGQPPGGLAAGRWPALQEGGG